DAVFEPHPRLPAEQRAGPGRARVSHGHVGGWGWHRRSPDGLLREELLEDLDRPAYPDRPPAAEVEHLVGAPRKREGGRETIDDVRYVGEVPGGVRADVGDRLPRQDLPRELVDDHVRSASRPV